MRQALRLCDALHGASDAEVGQYCVPLGEKDILRLDVAMDDAAGMRIGECARELAQDLQAVCNGEGALKRQAVVQRLPFHEGRDEVMNVGVGTRGEHREDVRVLQVGCDEDFALESRLTHAAHQLGRQDLDHHAPTKGALGGQEDVRHPATTELTLDLVSVSDQLLQVAEKPIAQHFTRGIVPPTIRTGAQPGQRIGRLSTTTPRPAERGRR